MTDLGLLLLALGSLIAGVSFALYVAVGREGFAEARHRLAETLQRAARD